MLDVYVALGSKLSSGGGSRQSEMIRAVEAYRHPLYRFSSELLSVTHDVAILKLQTPSKIHPARLVSADGSDIKPGMIATTLGWGLLKDNAGFSNFLQTVDLEIVTNKKCTKMYADADDNTIVDDSVICAGTGSGKGSCGGNAGGPLLLNDVVIGIKSAGPDKCGDLPGPFARVSEVVEFMKDIQLGGSAGNVTELLNSGTDTLTTAVIEYYRFSGSK
ncbi:Trypsin [Phytophthora infestans]|uniref:Trypsin n=1 Tax=Phytophthora infestans TaxID=4787 RepID=A0A8S9UF06_PHYIN|nr:Trypsin [Phytophthora infestans]KAI9980874.1 hypothetical protein PInf_010211 [Phytophthora infestans]